MNQLKDKHILLLGEAVIDFISEEIADSLEFAENFKKFPGGEVANLASNLARLGFPSWLASCVGDDGFGRFITNHLSAKGVNLDLLQISPDHPTTLIPVTRQTGTPDFCAFRGADPFLRLTDQLEDAASKAKAIHTSAFALSRDPSRSTILSVINNNQGTGKIISLDPNYHPSIWPDTPEYLSILKESIHLFSITKPSLDDSVRIFGPGLEPEEYLERFLELGPEIVVLTLGEKGAILGDSQGKRSQIHANHVPVVDVTGAGDAFWSGMIAGLLQQRSNLDSAKLGLILAESKISKIGPDNKDISLADYEKMIADIVSS